MSITVNDSELINSGNNVNVAHVDDKLVVIIDLKKTIGLSSTGKMMGIASTEGFITIPTNSSRNKIKMNLYIGERV